MASVILNASTGKARAVDGQVFADHGNGEIEICAYLRIRCETNKIEIARLTPTRLRIWWRICCTSSHM